MEPIQLQAPKAKATIKTVLNYNDPSQVRPYIDPSLSVAANRQREDRTIFVTHLPVAAQKADILRLFRAIGKIEKFWMKATVERSEPGGEFRSCYLMLDTPESAQRALTNPNGFAIAQQKLLVLPPNEFESAASKGVFIGNLDWELTEKEIRAHFEKVGEVEYVRVLRHRFTGKSKGICFLRFVDEASVAQALALDGKPWKGKSLKVVRNSKNPEHVLRHLQQAMTEVIPKMTEEELQELEHQNRTLAKSRPIDEGHYGVTMMENIIKHQGKVPSSIVGKKIKKLRRKNLDEATLAARVEKVKGQALEKLNKEVFEKDNLLKERREKRKMKQKYNAMRAKNSAKPIKKG